MIPFVLHAYLHIIEVDTSNLLHIQLHKHAGWWIVEYAVRGPPHCFILLVLLNLFKLIGVFWA